MNSLSWLLYVADVVGNVKDVLILFTIAIVMTMILFWIFRAMVSSTENLKDDSILIKVTQKKMIYVLLILFPIVAAIIPSSTTIYMITASEAGEVVVKSEEAREIFTGIKDTIKNKLKEVAP